MEDHFLYRVINALSTADHQSIKIQLEEVGKGRGLLLLKTLRGAPANITKEKVYEKVFDDAYTADKDYLIRNEFRLLKKVLEEYLLQKEIKTELKENNEWKNRLLGNVMMKHQLSGEALKYFEQAKEEALFNFHFDHATELNMAIFSLNYRNALQLTEAKTLMARNIEAGQKLAEHTAVYRSAQIQFQEALLKRISGLPPGEDKLPSSAEFIGQWTLAETAESLYYLQKAKAYGSFSIEDMETLLKMACELPPNTLMRNECITVKVQLATVHSMVGHFALADEYFQEILESDDFKLLKEKPSFYANYVRNLTKLKKYAAALESISQMEKLVLEPHLRSYLQTARITCYIFLEDTANLKKYLPNDFANSGEGLKYYYKLLYAIYFYLNNQAGMAIRELENLLETRNIDSEPEHREIARIMRSIFGMLEKEGSAKKSKAVLQKAKTAVLEAYDTAKPEVQNMLPFLWLKEKFGN
jgi:hypothetical protein